MTRRRARLAEAISRIALASALPILATPAQAGGWQRMADLPEANGGMVCYAAGEDIIVAGGTNWEDGSKRWLAKRWRFGAGASAWKPLPPLPAPLAYTAGDVDARTGAFITAGGSDGGKSTDTIVEWRGDDPPRQLARLPGAVTLAGAGVAGGRLFVVGGAADIADFGTVTARCFDWPVGSGDCRRLADYPAGPTALVAVAVTGTRVHTFTGATWDAATKQVVNLSAAFAFDLGTMKWHPIQPYPFAARGVAAVALDEKRVYLAGGFKGGEEGFTDAGFIYDIATDRYAPCAPLPIRAIAHLVKTGEWLWVVGGEDRQKHRSAACWRIRPRDLSR